MSRIGKHYSHLVVWQGRLLGLLAGVCQQRVLTTAYLASKCTRVRFFGVRTWTEIEDMVRYMHVFTESSLK